uniref:Uncharacterized protein n=2 Tax=Clastoptera arizonana TaxID=38151 RepID=A0A1B6CQ88_9HEMI
MKGYFYFNVSAFDSVNHTDSAHVQVYLISNANTVTFTFLNTLEYVNAQQNKIEEIFTSVFGFKGTVDSMTKAKDENQQVLQNQTEIRVHFIDTSENLPVNSEVILQQTANIAIINQLRAAFVSIALVLEDLQGEERSTTIDQNCVNQLWILFSVVVALLFGFIIALIGLYIWRTKSLQDRLDRMAAANSSEQQNDFSRNITLSTSNIYENKVNPVHGLALPAYLNDREEMDAYIDEALHGLEEKIDVTSEINHVSTA